MTRISVIGAGAMGCLFGGLLNLLPENEVTLVDTWREQVEAIRTNGLTLVVDQKKQTIPINIVLPEEILRPTDLAMIFTKSFHTEQALNGASKSLGPETSVLTLQNGLGNIEKISQFTPLSKIIVGVTTIPGDLEQPGVVSSHGGGETRIMSADGQVGETVTTLSEQLTKAGLNGIISEDIFVRIWEKVAFNSAFNSVCAATQLNVGGVGATEEGRSLVFEIVKETVLVANEKGIIVDLEKTIKMVEEAFDQYQDHKPSMLQDILAGRQTEIDSISGAVVEEAERLGVPVPVSSLMTKLVKVVSAGRKEDHDE